MLNRHRGSDDAVIRAFARPVPLLPALAVGAFVPVLTAAVRVVQSPLGAVPADSLRLAVAPIAFFLHALAGLVSDLVVVGLWLVNIALGDWIMRRMAAGR